MKGILRTAEKYFLIFKSNLELNLILLIKETNNYFEEYVQKNKNKLNSILI